MLVNRPLGGASLLLPPQAQSADAMATAMKEYRCFICATLPRSHDDLVTVTVGRGASKRGRRRVVTLGDPLQVRWSQ